MLVSSSTKGLSPFEGVPAPKAGPQIRAEAMTDRKNRRKVPSFDTGKEMVP